MPVRVKLAAAMLLLVAGAGCGSSASVSTPARRPTTTAPPPMKRPPHRLTVERARCAPGVANCAAATGRIVYVEAHDPDGDGDLHLVVVGGNVTLPGMTVFDIEKNVRPRRVPRIGDLASAAGPVYHGSYGQKQIQATELHVAYR